MKSFTLFDGYMPIAFVEYEGDGDNVILHRCDFYTSIWYDRVIYGKPESSDLIAWFERRVVPKHRFYTAHEYPMLSEYNAEKMCRVTHGVHPNDFYWMKFDTDPESLSPQDVLLRDPADWRREESEEFYKCGKNGEK